MRRSLWLKRLTQVFAILGVLASSAIAISYLQGWRAVQGLDPEAPEILARWAHRALATDIASATVVRLPVAPQVEIREVVSSMKLRANELNIKLISRLPFHKEIRALTGEDHPYLEIFQFCDARTAAELLRFNENFAAYMPCSIALYRDRHQKLILTTMNLDLLIHGGPELESKLKNKVLQVKDGLLAIMAAGANGEI